MKLNINGLVAFLILLNSCVTYQDLSEVKNLKRSTFEALQLKPVEEPNELRIDIIRQTREQNLNDSIQQTESMPYHPLGFDLGNGLFYDLNRNLSIRLEYLFNLSPGDTFTIQNIINPKKARGIITYNFQGNSFTINNNSRKKDYLRYIKSSYGDSSAYVYKSRLEYAIVKTDTSIAYRRNRRMSDIIYKSGGNQFYMGRGRRKEMFELTGNEIRLGAEYLIKLSEDKKRIAIERQGKRKTEKIGVIIKSTDKLFMYNNKHIGLKLEYKENCINIYINGKYIFKYEKL